MNVSLRCVLLLMIFTFESKASDLDEVIPELYVQYKEAIADENNPSLRRVFKRNKQYEIHVQKLKEVNGLKYHNLVLKEKLRNDVNQYIYISNPLESKIPKAFLTLDEFKEELVNRIERQGIITKTSSKTTASERFKTTVPDSTEIYQNKTSDWNKKFKSTIIFNRIKKEKEKIKKDKNIQYAPTKESKTIEMISKSHTNLSNLEKNNKIRSMGKLAMKSVGLKNVLFANITSKIKSIMSVTSRTAFDSTPSKLLTVKKGTLKTKSTSEDIDIMTTKPISSTETATKSTFINTTTEKQTTKTVTLKGEFVSKDLIKEISITHVPMRVDLMIKTLNIPSILSRKESISIGKITDKVTLVPETKLTYDNSTTETLITPKEVSKRKSTVVDKITEIVTENIITTTRESTYENLRTKSSTILKETPTRLSYFENITTTGFVPKEILRNDSTFEDKPTENLETTKIKSFDDITTERLWTTKRTKQRKAKTLNNVAKRDFKTTTKFKRLERPLVFMGGYENIGNKYFRDQLK